MTRGSRRAGGEIHRVRHRTCRERNCRRRDSAAVRRPAPRRDFSRSRDRRARGLTRRDEIVRTLFVFASCAAMAAAAFSPPCKAARSRGPPRQVRDVREAAPNPERLSDFRAVRREARGFRRERRRLLPAQNRRAIGQGAREPFRQKPAARRRHGAIDRRQQRALAVAGKRPRQFEIGARRGIDLHMGVAAPPRRQIERRAFPELRPLDIEDGERGSGEFARENCPRPSSVAR